MESISAAITLSGAIVAAASFGIGFFVGASTQEKQYKYRIKQYQEEVARLRAYLRKTHVK